MMFKSRRWVGFLSALAITSSAFALQEKQPAACPSMNSVKAEGVTLAAEVLDERYVTYNISHYDTSSTWVFIMGPLSAESGNDALVRSNAILATLSADPVPEEDEDNTWICNYYFGSDAFAAVAIQADDMVSPLRMSYYLRHSH